MPSDSDAEPSHSQRPASVMLTYPPDPQDSYPSATVGQGVATWVGSPDGSLAREPSAGESGPLPRWRSAVLRHARLNWRNSAWRALQYPDFRFYWAGSVISNLGTWLQNTAQVLLAYQLTHSVFAVGLVTCVQFSGSLFLGPWAAVVASRIGGRRMLIATQMFSAAIAGGLAWLQAAGLLGERLLIIGALGLGLAFTFSLPVQTALVPRLADEADTEAAMTMNSVSYNAGRALAPALCVLVIITIGFAWAFALNAASFVIFAVMLALSHPRPDRLLSPPARARDGLDIAMRQPRIALLLAMVAAVTLADDPVLILGPALAHRVGMANDWAGYFLSALGCGTVLGSLRSPKDARASDISFSSRRAARSLIVLVIAIMVFAAGLSPWLCLLAAFAAGAAALRTGAVTQTQLVRQSPGQAASVMALWAMAWAGTKPIASLIDGSLANTFIGVWGAAMILTVPALLLGIAELKLSPDRKQKIKKWARERGGPYGQSLLSRSSARLHQAKQTAVRCGSKLTERLQFEVRHN